MRPRLTILRQLSKLLEFKSKFVLINQFAIWYSSIAFWPSFKSSAIILLIFALVFVVVLFFSLDMKGTVGDVMQVIAVLLGLAVFYQLMVLFLDRVSFIVFAIQKHIYFINLKKTIIDSKDYIEFANIFYRRFPPDA